MKKIAAVLFALMLGSCAAHEHQPIYNVNDPIPANAQQLPLDKIEAIIIDAGTPHKWQFKHIDAGHLEAEQTTERASAIIDIYFDQKSWRTAYKASDQLLADPSKNLIHHHYNRWVHELEHSVSLRLAAAGAKAK